MVRLLPLREVIAHHQLSARKKLGQHFLLEPNLLRRIVKAAGALDELTIIEIGAGPGGLTRALLAEGASSVIAIEQDQRFEVVLQDLAASYPGKLQVIIADALALSIPQLTSNPLTPTPCKIIANLPYNIATALLIKWLHNLASIVSITVLVQKEVAARLQAPPHTKVYGRLSILAQRLCHVKQLFDIAPSAFTPQPKVTSSLVRLIPREPLPEDLGLITKLEEITWHAFTARRKMLRSSLKALFSEEQLLSIAIDPYKRAENLSVEEYVQLAALLVKRPG